MRWEPGLWCARRAVVLLAPADAVLAQSSSRAACGSHIVGSVPHTAVLCAAADVRAPRAARVGLDAERTIEGDRAPGRSGVAAAARVAAGSGTSSILAEGSASTRRRALRPRRAMIARHGAAARRSASAVVGVLVMATAHMRVAATGRA
jgi:hypothetical protein